jgi:hypothetical protein
MPIGDLISATDYNSIRTKIVDIMGNGSGTSGYGQTINAVTALSQGQTVTKSQWDNLRFDIYNALVHQTGSAPTITIVNEGDVIRYGTSHPNFQYNTLADQAITNKFNLGTGQFVTETVGSTTRSSDWSSSVQSAVQINFIDNNYVRYFFNSGGKIRFSSTRVGGTGTLQDQRWSSLLTGAGQPFFAANSGLYPSSSGNATYNNIGYWQLTTSDQQIWSFQASSPYTANTWSLLARLSSGNTITATSVIFTVRWTDSYSDPGAPAPGDLVTGNLTLDVDQVRARGSLAPAFVANSFAIAGPILSGGGASTVGSISGS